MNPNYLLLLKHVLAILMAVFGVLTTGFFLWGARLDERYGSTQAWFRAKWEAINNSAWLTLPERCIRWVLKAKERLAKFLALLIIGGDNFPVDVSLTFILFVSSWYYSGFFWALLITTAYGIFLLLLWVLGMWSAVGHMVTFSMIGSGRLGIRERLISLLTLALHLCYRIVGCLLISLIWLNLLLDINLTHAAVLLTILLPFSGTILAAPMLTLIEYAYDRRWYGLIYTAQRRQRDEHLEKFDPRRVLWVRVFTRHLAKKNRSLSYIIFFIFGANVGFALSFLAMLVGHIAEPAAYVPRNWQLLVVNFICDGLTLTLTFSVLNAINKKRGAFYLPFLLIVTLLLSALLAFCSLYLGLLFTDHPLQAREIFNILIARAPDGNGIQLSPYFWIMHTTFIPLLLYFAVILLCWLAKAFLLVARWYFGRGLNMKDPLKVSSAFCAHILALLALLSVLINLW